MLCLFVIVIQLNMTYKNNDCLYWRDLRRETRKVMVMWMKICVGISIYNLVLGVQNHLHIDIL